MNIATVPRTNMQSQNEFHLQPNSCFARKLHWKGRNPKPWQKEVGHHLDRDESTIQEEEKSFKMKRDVGMVCQKVRI